MRCKAAVQLLLVQACGEVYTHHAQRLSAGAMTCMLDTLVMVANHARQLNSNFDLRQLLLMAQLNDRVSAAVPVPCQPACMYR